MYADFYSQNPLLFWPLVGLAIFVVSFAAVMLYVLIGLRDQSKVDYLAELPLEPDSEQSVEPADISVAGGRV
jgi:hypothetical protein